jgi:hypothetical protein
MGRDLRVTRGVKVFSDEFSVIKADCDTKGFGELRESEVDPVYCAQESDIVRRWEEHDTSRTQK